MSKKSEIFGEKIFSAMPTSVFLGIKQIREITGLSNDDAFCGVNYLRKEGKLRKRRLNGSATEYRKVPV